MAKLDKAQELELAVFQRQQLMNTAMEDGDSPVQQFYAGSSVFVTGGAGFIGKQYIEKLLRACNLNKIYVLLRPKRGKTIQERLELMLKDPVYDQVRKKKPDFANIIEAVEGDVSELRLGLSEKDWTRITKEVNVVVHMAATIRFDGPLRDATITNVRGTRECVTFAKDCKKLKCLVHVSTAFTHATNSRVNTELKEEFYPCPVPPDVIIELAETLKPEKFEALSEDMTKDWPNTYTFTKAIAEEVIRTAASDLPVCIVKPPVVLPSYVEPCPGWTDISIVYSSTGIIIGVGMGVLHVFPVDIDKKLNLVPVDYVNNATITAAWDTHERIKHGVVKEIPIYNVSSTRRAIVFDFLGSLMRSDDFRRLSTPLAVWYCYLIEVTNPFLYWLLTWLLHYVPAYLADGVCAITGFKIKEIPSFTKFYKKVHKMSNVFGYFYRHEWLFCDLKLTQLISRMSRKDREIFNCDVNTIDYGQYLQVVIVGLRKYVIRDGLKDSYKAYIRQKLFYIANWIFMGLYLYILFCIGSFVFSTFKCIVF